MRDIDFMVGAVFDCTQCKTRLPFFKQNGMYINGSTMESRASGLFYFFMQFVHLKNAYNEKCKNRKSGISHEDQKLQS